MGPHARLVKEWPDTMAKTGFRKLMAVASANVDMNATAANISDIPVQPETDRAMCKGMLGFFDARALDGDDCADGKKCEKETSVADLKRMKGVSQHVAPDQFCHQRGARNQQRCQQA